MKQRYKALRGMRDILPGEVASWQFLEARAREVFERYGFKELRTPLLEATELFARSVGPSSDIVRKEMYSLERGGESFSLRPEGTASIVRAFLQHSLQRTVATGYPERYYYIGPMFRYERPQKGRQRQFHQIGVEVLGSPEPLADAETLEMVMRFLDELGIADGELLLGSVGDEACRPAYREALRSWLEPRLDRLCEDCNRRFSENPLRVFDCKVDADRELLAGAPSVLERLCPACSDHFEEVRRALDDYGVSYRLEGNLVRGLDYYRRTVFEVISPRLGAQDAILGGGRYDGLVEELGGPAMPAFGFAMGMERACMLIPAARIPQPVVDVALVALGPEGLRAGRGLAARLRRAGVATAMPVCERPLGAQIKRADKMQARFVVFVGGDELERGLYGLKEMTSGEQVTVDEQGILAQVLEAR
jgi:histidyl-tRNA synthetase